MQLSEMEIIDLKENLEKMEKHLLLYESSINNDTEDTSLVHFIFRFAHNLKSSLGMVHRQEASELIHAVETNFDLVRNGKIQGTVDLTQLSLKAIDLIQRSIDESDENPEEFRAIKSDAEEYKTRNANQGLSLSKIKIELSEQQKQKMQHAQEEGFDLYLIEKLINKHIDRELFESLPCFDDIAKIGELIAYTPLFEEIGSVDSDKDEIILKALFMTKIAPESLSLYIFDPFKMIKTKNGDKHPSLKKIAVSATVIPAESIEKYKTLLSNITGSDDLDAGKVELAIIDNTDAEKAFVQIQDIRRKETEIGRFGKQRIRIVWICKDIDDQIALKCLQFGVDAIAKREWNHNEFISEIDWVLK